MCYLDFSAKNRELISACNEFRLGRVDARSSGAVMDNGMSQRNSMVAHTAPIISARINHGTSAGRMPEKVFVKDRATATAGFAKHVEAVNQ